MLHIMIFQAKGELSVTIEDGGGLFYGNESSSLADGDGTKL